MLRVTLVVSIHSESDGVCLLFLLQILLSFCPYNSNTRPVDAHSGKLGHLLSFLTYQSLITSPRNAYDLQTALNPGRTGLQFKLFSEDNSEKKAPCYSSTINKHIVQPKFNFGHLDLQQQYITG